MATVDTSSCIPTRTRPPLMPKLPPKAGFEPDLRVLIRTREMEMTGGMLRDGVERHPILGSLHGGRRFMVCYGPDKVWLSEAGVTLAEVKDERWWDPGAATREDRAQELIASLTVKLLGMAAG